VPFLKFSRDKRGYENYYLFDGKGRPRLLFWFRTPPQVKVGRTPFSDDVRKMVEAQNPGLFFDWPRLMATPIPSPDVDHWRERRRLEKAAKRAAREADAESEADAEVIAETEAQPIAVAEAATGAREDTEAVVAAVEAESPLAASDVQSGQPSEPGAQRRKRRRRRGRRGGTGQPGAAAPVTDVAQPESASLPEPETPPDDEV
jgi:hypothetical protein